MWREWACVAERASWGVRGRRSERGTAQSFSVTAREKSEKYEFWSLGDAHDESEPAAERRWYQHVARGWA